MRKIIIIIMPILLFTIITSCATKITDMNIAQTKLTVMDMNENTVKKLLPDSIYNIIIKITDTDGIEYIDPNYRNFKIENPTKVKIENQAFFSLRLKTSIDTFHEEGTKAYSFELSVKENLYPALKYEYPLDWENYDTLNFNGKNGNEGEDGDPGLSASGESIENVTGSSGGSGTDGMNGYHGENIELLVLKYQYEGIEKLFFYEINQKMLFLTNLLTINIDTSGGDGGRGGSGGNGGYGNSYTDELDVTTEGVSGNPGDGGDGGKGGSGGDIILLAADSDIFTFLNPLTTGGSGGQGGRSGKSYDNATSTVYRGDRGKTDQDGWDGDIEFKILEKTDIIRILESITDEAFEISRVNFGK